MKRTWLFVLLLAGSAVWGGCTKTDANGAGTPAIPGLPTKAQPKLATIKLWLGTEELIAEMALTPIQEQTGMMFRTNMAENEGMIFVLNGPQRASFWMMNCPMPLSAAYIDPDGKILELHDLQPHNTNSVVANSDNVQFVLETKQGWFQRHNIKEGSSIVTEKGTLKRTFLQ